MGSKAAAGAFSSQATAGCHMAAPEFAPLDDLFVTARTTTTPNRFIGVRAASVLQHGQSTECLTSDINGSGQGDLLQRLLGQVMGWRSNAGPSRILALGIML
jgi:hypothetical protein